MDDGKEKATRLQQIDESWMCDACCERLRGWAKDKNAACLK